MKGIESIKIHRFSANKPNFLSRRSNIAHLSTVKYNYMDMPLCKEGYSTLIMMSKGEQ